MYIEYRGLPLIFTRQKPKARPRKKARTDVSAKHQRVEEEDESEEDIEEEDQGEEEKADEDEETR